MGKQSNHKSFATKHNICPRLHTWKTYQWTGVGIIVFIVWIVVNVSTSRRRVWCRLIDRLFVEDNSLQSTQGENDVTQMAGKFQKNYNSYMLRQDKEMKHSIPKLRQSEILTSHRFISNVLSLSYMWKVFTKTPCVTHKSKWKIWIYHQKLYML